MFNEFDEEIIRIESEALARLRGLNPERVKTVFQRLAEVGSFTPNFPFSTALDEAFGFFEPPKALNIFEKENLSELAHKVAIVDYIGDKWTPFYSLDEAAEILEAFIVNQQHNRESLIRTGYPKISFERSRWIDSSLNRLYYVKSAVGFNKAIRNKNGDFEYSYVWKKNITKDWEIIRSESYEDGMFFDFLTTEEANLIEDGRYEFYKLKISILKETARAINLRTTHCLWKNCLRLMTESLTSRKAEFYLRIDRLYTGYDIRSGKIVSEDLEIIAGGLSGLLELIGHCWKEIELGTLANTRDALDNCVAIDTYGVPKLNIQHYFQVIGSPKREIIDNALNLFLELSKREDTF